ncbi:AAA domain-containing protein, partial [Blyttiomyces helicus]
MTTNKPGGGAASSARRIDQIRNALTAEEGGDVTIPLATPRNPELVPSKCLVGLQEQANLEHLQWMMRKDLLGQDIFLIGPPGPAKRHLALSFLHLANREGEYIALHRDISDADLKQRREIVREGENEGGALTAKWIDGVAVRAAIEGRVLIIEGIEKAERNTLPLLNNLLENREMNLEDGRHIIHPARYDSLLASHSKSQLDTWRLVRASERFRVIALGVPVPPFPGNPLDPPFRSRFQVRYVDMGTASAVDTETKSAAVRAVADLDAAIKYSYEIGSGPPHGSKIDKSGAPLKHARTPSSTDRRTPYDLVDVVQTAPGLGVATFRAGNESVSTPVVLGTAPPNPPPPPTFVQTPRLTDLTSRILQSHALSHDICIVGPKGSGKTLAVHRFAALVGLEVENVALYRDMTARDLMLRRGTRKDGSTFWEDSALTTAALTGKLAILDGLEWIPA